MLIAHIRSIACGHRRDRRTLLLKLDDIIGLPDSPLDANVEAEKRNYRAAPRERIEQGDP